MYQKKNSGKKQTREQKWSHEKGIVVKNVAVL